MRLHDAILTPFTASDGENIALHDWAVPPGTAVRGVVVLVHGLGEHAGRYERLAGHLAGWGYAVRGYDQYGHGESSGQRGGLSGATRLLDDLADVIDSTRRRLGAQLPVILLGHSLGGLVAASLVARHGAAVDGLVLSSPAFDAGLGPLQKFLLATLPRIAPDLTVGNGLDPDFLSHDPGVVAAYRADPLVHDRISGRLALFIAEEGPQVLGRAAQWKVPTLLLYAGADRLVNPQGSRAFARAAPPSLVTARCFDDLFHEIFNEVDAQPVLEALRQWLQARF
ncbi:lysophospholipase [Ramlibacter sp.]|uniref:alpha/beta hydrolase n=1 Tax=Ramlibacter sp. TaxID=1917967 RepID=UPI002BA67CB9|nr:lysophospholipase [Ramlibacter sp.]HWI80483.1 lysophospholipase [Ramlibacter sp.]